jgi:hypothetical protein
MEEDRMPKKIFIQELEGTRRRGRPRKGWKDEVERDIQVVGVRRRRKMVTGRKNGRTLFNRPKLTAGCSANGRRRRILKINIALRNICLHNLVVEPKSLCCKLVLQT